MTADEQWYEVRTYYGVEINPVKVVRETQQSVFVERQYAGGANVERRLKLSQGESYIKGFVAAKDHALSVARRKLEFAKTALHEAEKALEKIAAMQPPIQPENGETQ